MSLGPEWDSFEQDGHTFVRGKTERGGDLWTCARCGSTKDDNCYTGLPDDTWAKLPLGGSVWRYVDSCDEAVVFAVMRS